MYTIPDNNNNKYYIDMLRECHDKLKNHKFREIFHEDINSISWRAQCEDFRKLIYNSTEILSHMAYYNNDETPIISTYDTNWIHDFRSFLIMFYNIHIYPRDWMNNYKEDLDMTIYDFYKMQGFDDIRNIMMFLDRYIQYLHQFIETGVFNKIAAIKYEKYSPGWYTKKMLDYEKRDDGKWYWVE